MSNTKFEAMAHLLHSEQSEAIQNEARLEAEAE